MVICLERGADLHMAQLMPLPLTVSCFSNIQIGFTFLVPAHPGGPGKRAVKRVCVCVCVCVRACVRACVRVCACLFKCCCYVENKLSLSGSSWFFTILYSYCIQTLHNCRQRKDETTESVVDSIVSHTFAQTCDCNCIY